MIMVKYRSDTGIVRIAINEIVNGEDKIEAFEFSTDLFERDPELFDLYMAFRRHGHIDSMVTTSQTMWMTTTNQNTAEMDHIRLIVESYIEGFVRRVARESVLA